jgi:hypothetical protein
MTHQIPEPGPSVFATYSPTPPNVPTLRLTVEFREIGPGVEQLEITWEHHVPDAYALARLLAAVLTGARSPQ